MTFNPLAMTLFRRRKAAVEARVAAGEITAEEGRALIKRIGSDVIRGVRERAKKPPPTD